MANQYTPREPTIKMIKTAQNVVEGDSMRQAMLKAGYSEATAKNPQALTTNETFLALLEKHGVTDKKIAATIQSGLDAEKQGEPDHAVRHKYVETSLKLKGYTEKPKDDNVPTLRIELHNMTDQQLEDELRKYVPNTN